MMIPREALRAAGRQLLLQYCQLDTTAMVMIWMYWLNSAPTD